jgi:hypothetical protein
MKKITLAVFALCCSATTFAATHNGIGDARRQPGPITDVTPTASAGINFDDVVAPCVFVDAVALRSYGDVMFTGKPKQSLNGAAIIDECGGFDVTGYSAPNFLAVACGAVMSDGGEAKLPEFISFPTPVNSFSLGIGSSDEGQVKVTANGPAGQKSKTITMSSTLQRVKFKDPVQSVTIKTLNETETCIIVIDDISWKP